MHEILSSFLLVTTAQVAVTRRSRNIQNGCTVGAHFLVVSSGEFNA
jgi:hypothetical protein